MKLATHLPKPRKLTKEDLDRIAQESDEWRKAVEEGTKGLETLTAEDFVHLIN